MNLTGKLIALFCLMLSVHGWAADFDILPSATDLGDKFGEIGVNGSK